MRMLRVEGGRRLCGQARVARAKNAVLPILAASLLTDDTLLVEDAPRIDDAVDRLIAAVEERGVALQLLLVDHFLFDEPRRHGLQGGMTRVEDMPGGVHRVVDDLWRAGRIGGAQPRVATHLDHLGHGERRVRAILLSDQ